MSEHHSGGTEVPTELSRAPETADGKRVLGVVPGKPVAGERKTVDRDDMVMVWPHLLVRHAASEVDRFCSIRRCCLNAQSLVHWAAANQQ